MEDHVVVQCIAIRERWDYKKRLIDRDDLGLNLKKNVGGGGGS